MLHGKKWVCDNDQRGLVMQFLAYDANGFGNINQRTRDYDQPCLVLVTIIFGLCCILIFDSSDSSETVN